ncbi:hypothetical protein [Paenibacillus sp. FSL R7-0337]|uniref:hypothetical protein n=1 Tax=Paenibacillus sp. FSL R7-0337 TaxID=1926588 RepID=UPI00096D4DD8|nr:hypothetical protein [Paenibacillus sp. FSL R7-0337]OMG00534.1 hypothetical protein BK147_04890 [Paenibacillus sp. FSL R7-0337]
MTNHKRKPIAILGATGHISKNLILGLAAAQEYELYLFSRSRERMTLFLEENQLQEGATLCEYDQFAHIADYDVIINGVGIGDPRDLIQHPFQVFQSQPSVSSGILRNYQVEYGGQTQKSGLLPDRGLTDLRFFQRVH